MRRLEPGSRLVIASHNAGKVREFGALLQPFGIAAVSAGDLNFEEPEEDGASFVANAQLKAHASATLGDAVALSDDSGLGVHALDGEPGIHSARWAGPDRDFRLAMQRVEDALQERGATTPQARRAHFVCVLCLAWPDGEDAVFEGRIDGTLVWPPRGDRGFGYDPVFLPDGYDLTFGEMQPAAKHAISHRARAFARLKAVALPDD